MAAATLIGQAGTASNVNSITATLTAAASVADLVFVFAFMDDPTTVTSGMMTDTGAGNTYTVRDGWRWNSASDRAGEWDSVLAGALTTSNTVTFTPTTNTGMGLYVVKVTGLAASPFDKVNDDANQSAVSPDTGATGVLTQADEVVFASYCWKGTNTLSTAPTGFTQLGTVQTFATPQQNAALFYQIVSATTTLNPTCTLSGSSQAGGGIVTYKSAGAASKSDTDSTGVGADVGTNTARITVVD